MKYLAILNCNMKKLILLSILILLAACGKPRTIKIIAENVVTGTRYAGLSYKVVSSKTTGNGEKYQTEAAGVLNENGEAVVDIKVKKGRSYSVRIGALENICYHNELDQYFESKYDVNGTFTYKFAECAYLIENIENLNCQGASDHMVYFLKNSVNSLGSSNGWEFNGCALFNGTSYSKVPIGHYYHEWHVTKNGVTNIFYDTTYLQENEYKIYNLNY